jgi:hypothetical protein
VGLCGCEPAPENLKSGELGNGTFEYLCKATTDAQCDEGETVSQAAFDAIARAGVFGLSFLDEYGNATSDEIEAAGDGRITYDDQTQRWTAEKAGLVALIAFEQNGGVEDFVHATVVEPSGVVISEKDLSGHFTGSFGGATIDVSIQSDFILRVAPADALQNVLAGGLPCQWTSDNPAVAAISSDATDNVITVHPVAAGSATLHVQLGSVSGQTTLTVGG